MLIFIIGLPGTGKTTIAKWLSDRFDVEYLSTEELRAEYLGVSEEKNDCDFSEEQQIIIYSLMVERARSVLDKDGSVIIEGVYRTKEQRDAIFRLFSEYEGAKFYFWITCDLTENRRRVINRKDSGTISPAGIVGFEKIRGEFVIPDTDEPYIKIDNTYRLSDVEELIEMHISEKD